MARITARTNASVRLAFGTVAAIALAISGAGEARAAVTWSAERQLAHGSYQFAQPCDAVARSDGRVIVTWRTTEPRRSVEPHVETAWIARRSATGRWGKPRVIWRHKVGLPGTYISKGIYARCPLIAPGSHGTVDLLWDQGRETPTSSGRVRSEAGGLFMRRMSARGRWSPPRLIARRQSVADTDVGQVVDTNRRGEAAVVLYNSDAVITRSARGRWGHAVRLRRPTRHVGPATVALGEHGQAVVAWLDTHREEHEVVRAVVRAGTGAPWTSPQVVSDTSGRCPAGPGVVHAAVADSGVSAVAWACSTNTAAPSVTYYAVQTAWRAPVDAAWRRDEVEVSTSTFDGGVLSPYASFWVLDLAFDAADTARVQYLATNWPGDRSDDAIETYALHAADRPAAATAWAAPTTAMDFPHDAQFNPGISNYGSLISDGDGRAVLFGSIIRAGSAAPLPGTFVSTRSPEGAWTGLEPIPSKAKGSEVAVLGGGVIIYAFQTLSHGRYGVRARIGRLSG